VRDVVAWAAALVLLLIAASLATTLQHYRRRRQRAGDSEHALGRRIIAELPVGDHLIFFSEDAVCFHYGDQSIDKDLVLAVRVLINGSPIAAAESTRARRTEAPTSFDDRAEGIARDRWDVAIEMERETVLVQCGAIRERVSQELARNVFDAVKQSIEAATTPSPRPRPGG